MKKRILGRVLGGVVAFATVFSVMSSTVLAAADYTLTLKGGNAYQGDTETVASTADYGGTLTYDAETGWTMNNFTFETSAATAVDIKNDADITLKGTNTIKSTYKPTSGSDGTDSYGINSKGNIIITGEEGSLTVTGGGSHATSYGIKANSIEIESGTVTAEGGYTSKGDGRDSLGSYGIHTTFDTEIKGGTVVAIGGSAGNQSCGIISNNRDVKILGGNVTATGGNVNEGKYTYGITAGNNFIMNAGELIATGGDCSQNGKTVNSKGIFVWDLLNNVSIDSPLEVVEGTINDTQVVIIKAPSAPADPENPSGPVDHANPVNPVEPVISDTPQTSTTQSATIADKDVSVTVNNGAVAVSDIPKDMIKEIADSATNGSAIVLDVSKVEGGSNTTSKVTLTKETLSNIAEALTSSENNKENLVVKTKAATVSIDAKALSSVVSQAKDENIQIVVENKVNANLNDSQQAAVKGVSNEAGKEVVQTFEAYIVSGTEKITDLNGGEVTVGKLDIKLDAAKDPKKYQVYTVTENGELVLCNTWVENGAIFFKTGTLSNYVLVYDANL